jgi:hypothetical protein
MKQSKAGDHISSSLTDLMTSLMVIFILLLVAKLNNQAKRTGRTVDYVAHRLNAAQLFKAGEKMRQDGDVIVVAVPQEVMSFKEAAAEHGGADLSPLGRAYLRDTMPKLAAVLCKDNIRKYIDTIVVEGHSDSGGVGEPEYAGKGPRVFSRSALGHRPGRCASAEPPGPLRPREPPRRAAHSGAAGLGQLHRRQVGR